MLPRKLPVRTWPGFPIGRNEVKSCALEIMNLPMESTWAQP